MTAKPTWLQGAVIYQIYPRSFYDAKGTGIGNLEGIIQKLDYLGGNTDSLGVTAIWLSPIYTSPMADFGYDVMSYTDVDPIFGTIQDVERLVVEAHKRSIKVMLDFVPNHTSDEHSWFIESSSSMANPKRDWYVWHDPNEDNVPNNWLSVFGGSAWELSPTTGQYYLHSFLKKQPDLNWDNTEVREAMKAAMRFWLDKGVDSFRMDAVDWLSKDPEFQDDPADQFAINKTAGVDYESLRHMNSRDGSNLYARLDEMASVLAEYDERFMVLEAHPETDDKVAGYIEYYKGVNPRLSAPFNFESIYLPWEAPLFREFINRFQSVMQSDYVPIYTIGNHDESRVASRIGLAAARTAALALLTLPGIAFVYYGEELGMTDVSISEDQIRDPFSGPKHGRDPERTPMQWEQSNQAGFTNGTPWLPVATNYQTVNVAVEAQDPNSFLSLYKQLIHFRKESPALRYGQYEPVNGSPTIFAYKRKYQDEELLVLLNFSDQTEIAQIAGIQGSIRLSTFLDKQGLEVVDQLELRPNEGVIIKVTRGD